MTSIAGTETVILAEPRRFNWGAAIAGAAGATATGFFLLTLGAGVGLAIGSPGNVTAKGLGAFLTLGAVYYFAAQAFAFAVGGYLVGRLIGPEVESRKEEEFRAAAHGFVMWAITIVASLVLVGLSSAVAGSTLYAGANRTPASSSGYFEDLLFSPAANSPGVIADKAEAGRILAKDMLKAKGTNDTDTTVVARMVSLDVGIPMAAAMTRVTDVETQMRQDADAARKAASILSFWTAFALLFGAVVAAAAAISARWTDDRITFSMAPRP